MSEKGEIIEELEQTIEDLEFEIESLEQENHGLEKALDEADDLAQAERCLELSRVVASGDSAEVVIDGKLTECKNAVVITFPDCHPDTCSLSAPLVRNNQLRVEV